MSIRHVREIDDLRQELNQIQVQIKWIKNRIARTRPITDTERLDWMERTKVKITSSVGTWYASTEDWTSYNFSSLRQAIDHGILDGIAPDNSP